LCHVLIIEDEPLIAFDLEDLLGDHGARTFRIVDGQKAAVDASYEIKPDFIVSDVSLREGTGPLAVQEIHRIFGVIPVIFITATPDACRPCNPPGRVFRKPMNRAAIGAAFREMASVD